MKVLGIGDNCDLGAMYLRMKNAGDEVKVFVKDPDYQDVYKGFLNFIKNWEDELSWIKQAGKNGIIIFETATYGTIQDDLRSQGFQVIGGSAFGDRLENDRDFGQKIMQQMGMQTANSHRFYSYQSAIKFVKKTKSRYVFKNNGGDTLRTENFVGMIEDGSDLIALLELYLNHSQHSNTKFRPDFILMEHITGVEIGIGAFFNGECFLKPVCLDWEHKRFFTGNLGELTGEMGTVVTYKGSDRIFNLTLVHLESELKKSGYCGYINLNMIANNRGLWPLEFTSRFGYPGFSVCGALHKDSWGIIFSSIIDKSQKQLRTFSGFATGVVLTVPPFPYKYGYAELSKGTPIFLDPSLTDKNRELIDFTEVEIIDGKMFMSGVYGCVATAIGRGKSINSACKEAYIQASKVIVPNVRYRLDIGKNLMEKELNQLINWGYLNKVDFE